MNFLVKIASGETTYCHEEKIKLTDLESLQGKGPFDEAWELETVKWVTSYQTKFWPTDVRILNLNCTRLAEYRVTATGRPWPRALHWNLEAQTHYM